MSRSISTFKLFELFPDEESARKYLEGRLWADGVRCPECKGKERITERKNGYYRCNPCKLDFTIRTGTIFERSHVPLHKWVYAMYLVVTSRKGISSLQLAKEIGVTQKSAWFMLQRLREACSQNSDKLRGIVEMNGEAARKEVPPELDAIADVVLAYKPKPKTKAAKRRKRRAQNAKRKSR
jgi:transposase-like protein